MKKTMTKTQLVTLLMAAVVSTVLAGAALATPGSGILSAPVLARASFVDPVDIKFKVGGADATSSTCVTRRRQSCSKS